MKKLFVSYANCQSIGICHFLKKTPMAQHYDFKLWNNWQIVLKEQDPAGLLEDAERADVFLYQPTDAMYGALSTGVFCNEVVPKDCIKISYPYIFNTGFFPIVKSGKFWTGDWWLHMAKESPENLVKLYDNGMMQPFDCARRFAENLAEQSRREAGCTIKLAPWILENFQTQHLFLLCNHPASALLIEAARRILVLAGYDDMEIPITHPNEAALPGWHALHPAVKRELGIQYDQEPGGDMEFYRALFAELAETKGIL